MYDHYAYIMKALRDGRPITQPQFFAIGVLGVFSMGLNYVWSSGDATLYDTWPKLGLGLTFVITTMCLLAIPFGRRQDWTMHQIRISLCMVLIACCIRQYEENVFDLTQQEGAFIPFVNKMFDAWVPGFHCNDFQGCFFNKYNTMAYNTAGLWPLYMLMPFFFTSTPLFAMCACGVAMVSSCGHVVASTVMMSYCPGTFSAVFLVGPSAVYATTLLCNNFFVGHASMHVTSMAAGGFCHAAVGVMFFTVNMLGYLPQWLFPIAMYAIFSVELGLVCRLYGGPLEKFILKKKLERDRERYPNADDLDDENSALL